MPASSTVSLPRYTSASSALKNETAAAAAGADGAPGTTTSGAAGASGDAWGGAGDPLDFDLLAEYLLDDGAAGAGDLDISFDFNVETPPINPADQAGSTIVSVSPEQQAEISFADPLADATAQLTSSGGGGPADGDIAGDLAQVQQMIATQAASMSTTNGGNAQSAASSKIKNGVSRPPGSNSLPPRPPYGGNTAQSRGPFHPAATTGASATALDSNKRRRVDASAPLTATSTAVSGMAHSSSLPGLPPQKGGRQKSQAQIDRRRERNRILARRTRLRKKFFFESLQKEVTDLQRENALLKELVRNRLQPDIAGSILEQCKANEEIPDIVAEEGHGILDKRDHNFMQSVQKSQQCFVITDPSLQDNPIVYASDDFLTLTGYSREEVLGRNCRFLQGNETSRSKIAQIRKAIENGEDCSVTLINYAANGTAFWNNLFIAALRDAENNIVNFIGVIVKVAGPEPGDAEHGVKLPGENSPTSAMDPDIDDSAIDADAAAKAAEGTLMGLEGAVTAAVAAAPSLAK